MKILQVVPYFFVDWAGGREGNPVETVYGLSKALTKRGHQITIYTTDALSKGRRLKYPTEPLDMHGIKVCEFKSLGGKLGQRYPPHISPSMISVMAEQTVTHW